jgi:hypothetical protein
MLRLLSWIFSSDFLARDLPGPDFFCVNEVVLEPAAASVIAASANK